jgi:hypothetical protein
MPEARTEVAGTAGLGGIVVVGGLRADGLASDRADVYDVDAGEWRSLPPLPSGLHHAGMATVRGRVHVVGGFTLTEDRQWAESPRALSLGPGETAWRDEPPLPFPRGALALVSTGSHLVALGGVSGGKVVSAVWTWRPGDADWTDAPAMAQAREHTAAAFLGGRVYAIAGRVGPLESNLASVESWAPGEAAWRPEPSLAHARGGIGATAVGDTVCVAGGEEPGATIGSVECLRDGRWREVATLATPRHGLAVVAFGGKLHVIGGGPQPGLFVSAAHEELTVG